MTYDKLHAQIVEDLEVLGFDNLVKDMHTLKTLRPMTKKAVSDSPVTTITTDLACILAPLLISFLATIILSFRCLPYWLYKDKLKYEI